MSLLGFRRKAVQRGCHVEFLRDVKVLVFSVCLVHFNITRHEAADQTVYFSASFSPDI